MKGRLCKIYCIEFCCILVFLLVKCVSEELGENKGDLGIFWFLVGYLICFEFNICWEMWFVYVMIGIVMCMFESFNDF